MGKVDLGSGDQDLQEPSPQFGRWAWKRKPLALEGFFVAATGVFLEQINSEVVLRVDFQS